MAIVLKGMDQTIKDKQVQQFLGRPVLCGPVCTIFCPQITTAGTTSPPTASLNPCVTINPAVTTWSRVACPSVVLYKIQNYISLYLSIVNVYEYRKHSYMNKVSLTYKIKKNVLIYITVAA